MIRLIYTNRNGFNTASYILLSHLNLECEKKNYVFICELIVRICINER